MMSRIIALFLVALFGFVCTASAAEWGNLSGRFVHVGTPPTPQAIAVEKDKEVCSKHNLVDESLRVGKDGGIANVVIFARTKVGQKLAIHPDYEKTAAEPVKIDNHNCRFEPHIITARVGQPVVIGNSDPVGHNSKLDPFTNPAANPVIEAGKTFETKFAKPENTPVPVSCNIHPWMKGFIVVRPDPYVAVSKEAGTFEIKNLPAGSDIEFQVWQENPGAVLKAEVDGKPATWSQGRFTRKIVAGDNKLGDIKIDAAALQKK
jgi:plastocyanin